MYIKFIIQSYSKLKTKTKLKYFLFAPPSVMLPSFNNFWLAVMFQFLLLLASSSYDVMTGAAKINSWNLPFVKKYFKMTTKQMALPRKIFNFEFAIWMNHRVTKSDIKQHNILWDFFRKYTYISKKIGLISESQKY